MKRVHQTITRTGNLIMVGALILAAVSFTSCIETELPTVDKEVTFEVELVKMASLEIKSAEGEHLEIYGSVMAQLIRDNVTETNTIWSVDDPASNYISVGLNDVLLNETTSFTVLESDLDASTLEVTADLSDYDSATNPAEFLGRETIATPLSAVTNTLSLQMVLRESGGQVIQVTYAITRL